MGFYLVCQPGASWASLKSSSCQLGASFRMGAAAVSLRLHLGWEQQLSAWGFIEAGSSSCQPRASLRLRAAAVCLGLHSRLGAAAVSLGLY